MTSAMPSKINFGKGASLSVYSTYRGAYSELRSSAANELRLSLQNALMRSSYYSLNTSWSSGGRLEGIIVGTERKSYQNSSWLELDILVEGWSGSTLLFRNRYHRSAHDYGSGYDISSACNAVAEDVMGDIEPYTYTYKEKVKGHKENPSIELAAKACAAGNWNQGEAYALEALKVNANEAEAYFVLGLVERNRRNWNASNSYFEKAASADPSNAKYRNAILRNGSFRRNEEAYNSQMR